MNIEYRSIEDLKENDKNPRRITRTELEKLKRSINEFGFIDPIIVNQHTDRKDIIVGGHQRIKAAKELGMKQVPCVYIDVPETKENLLNIALNEISGDWDETKLHKLLLELQEQNIDLTLTGFDEPVIDEILKKELEDEKMRHIDDAPELPQNPKSKTGDLYKLGRHYLLCGDSTNPEDFNKLMRGVKADCCWTDPPYGVSYVGKNNPNCRDWGVMNNDDLRSDELYNFLSASFKNVAEHTKEKIAFYCCYASINHIIFEKALTTNGFRVKQQIIWNKGHILGHSDYHWCHEPILYCVKQDYNCEWYADRTHKTVLQDEEEPLEDLPKEQLVQLLKSIKENSDVVHLHKDPSQEYVHPTQKPVSLSKGLFKNNTRPNDIILEPFAGSGSTLMACETSQRICYAMEINPKYVDVILKRFEDFTGTKPEKINGDEQL